MFHALFALLNLHPALGFAIVAFAAAFAFVDFFGWLALGVAGVGCVFYEWIFWVPSRRQLILRNPRSAPTEKFDHLIGLHGLAATDLKPTGVVTVGGIQRSARSAFGVIPKGEPVVIESVGDFEITVRKEDGQPGE